MRTAAVPSLDNDTIANKFCGWVDADDAELHSDLWQGYHKVGEMCRVHKKVNHRKEYTTADGTHCNGVENAWSLFARSVMGSFHKISRKHLAKYLWEFDARFNARAENGTYFHRIIAQTAGRRLSMKQLVGGSTD